MKAIRSHREAEALFGEFVTTGGIAARADVERNVVGNWVNRHHDTFPAPVGHMGNADVWWWPEVELWLKLSERLT